jgi:3-phenylpropionate/cinnamic acid dioxygenase small subunit
MTQHTPPAAHLAADPAGHSAAYPSGTAISRDDHHAVEQFLYREARLLDDRRYEEWLALLTDDCEYRVPTRSNQMQSRGAAAAVDEEFGDLSFFEDNKLTLIGRVLRLGTGKAWAENPPSRTRRIVTNIETEPGDAPAELRVYSNLVLYRSRGAGAHHWFIGQRRDVLRRTDTGFQLLRRCVVLDTSVLDSPNLSVFL